MFPYITIWTTRLYMTWIWIVVSLLVFIIVASYLCNKFKQSFWTLFYNIPIVLVLSYVLWTYFNFAFKNWFLPENWAEVLSMLSPYNFSFSLVWIILWITIWFTILLKNISRYENKKVRIDILFISTGLALIPLGFFLLLGDEFIWNTTESFLAVRSLHIDSELNKFSGVFPIWLFLMIWSLVSTTIIVLAKRKIKQFWIWMIWFVMLCLVIGITIIFQQYPRHWVISITKNISLDIKHYILFLVAMYCLLIYYKRKNR